MPTPDPEMLRLVLEGTAERIESDLFAQDLGEAQRIFEQLHSSPYGYTHTAPSVPYTYRGSLSLSVSTHAPQCFDCANFVGGRNAFHCAMYPTGPDAEQCPDWEDSNSPEVRR